MLMVITSESQICIGPCKILAVYMYMGKVLVFHLNLIPTVPISDFVIHAYHLVMVYYDSCISPFYEHCSLHGSHFCWALKHIIWQLHVYH